MDVINHDHSERSENLDEISRRILREIPVMRKCDIVPEKEHEMLQGEKLEQANDSIADKCAK